jgi:hypothetical protein
MTILCLPVARRRVTMTVPFRSPALPAIPSLVSIGRGFLFACSGVTWYILVQSPRNGKLRATWTTIRNLLRCSHRSDEKATDAAVSCVEPARHGSRDVADTPRRLSGSGLLPADRQRVTTAYALPSTSKPEQRKPATRWAMRRKVLCFAIERTTQTKDLRFGSTDGTACRLGEVVAYWDARAEQACRGPAPCMARHGSGVRVLTCAPFFWLNQAVISAPQSWRSHPNAERT